MRHIELADMAEQLIWPKLIRRRGKLELLTRSAALRWILGVEAKFIDEGAHSPDARPEVKRTPPWDDT